MNDWTFPYRLAIGLPIFAVLLAVELWRRPREPRRLKEYSFLFGVTVLAVGYGIAHDFVTWSVCRDYYVIGKGIPSAARGYTVDIVKLAAKATWSVGLLGAAILLLANNPDRLKRQLPYRTLLKLGLIPLSISVGLETLLGVLFYLLAELIARAINAIAFLELSGPRFFAVWGMHIGAYLGGAIGIILAALIILRLKKRVLSTADLDASKG